MKNVLILGAGSDVGASCADEFARNGFNVQLAGRKSERFQAHASDLQIRFGIESSTLEFDAANFSSHIEFVASLDPMPDVVVCMFGYLGDQEKAQKEWSESERIITSNYTGAVSILNCVANAFEEKGQGTIVGVSSVAGERGRMSNYYYGSAKAGFTAYLSGLRNRLAHKGVHVLTVKPGFMDTKMTEGMPLPKPLTASAQKAAKAIYKAATKNKNVLYVKSIWRLIMWIIRNIPESIFKKLKL